MMRTLLKRPTTIFLRGVLGLTTLLSLHSAAYGQCTFYDNAYGNTAAPAVIGETATVSGCSYSGEYGTISNFQTMYKYIIDISDLTDPYITVFDMSDNVVAFGAAPFEFIPPADGTYKCQWTSAPPACGTDSDCHTTTVKLEDYAVPPTCPQPNNFGLISVVGTTGQVEWTAGASETEWVVEYGLTGFTPGSGTYITSAVSPQTISGLTANNLYDVYVRAVCGPGDTSFYEGPVSLNTFGQAQFLEWDTECGPGFTDISATGTALNLTDDSYAGVTLPFPWLVKGQQVTEVTIGNNGGIVFNTLTGGSPYTPFDPGMYPFAQDLNTALAGGGVYYKVTGTPGNRKFIVQWNEIPHYGFPATGDASNFEVIYDEATTEFYYLYEDVIMSNEIWDNGADAVISAITPDAMTLTVSDNNADFLEENSCVHFSYTDCPRPDNISFVYIAADEVAFDWDAGLANETDWTVEYGPAGFTPGTGQTFTTTSSDAIITSLNQLTEYDFYIYAECSVSMTSNGAMGSFTTLPYCSNPGSSFINTAVDSVFANWTWTQGSPSYPVVNFNYQYGPLGYELYSGPTYTAAGTNNADTIEDTDLLAGGVYVLYVQAVCDNGPGLDTSAFSGPFEFIMPISNDVVCGSEQLSTDGTVYVFNNSGATVQTGENVITPPQTGYQENDGWGNSTLNSTVWFTFIAPPSGSVRINNTAINYDGQAAVYEVFDCDDFSSFTMVSANDDAIGGTSSAPNFTACGLTPGNTYYLLVDGNFSTGNYAISMTPISVEAGNALATAEICSGESVDLFSTISPATAGGEWSSSIPAVQISIDGSDFYSEGLAYQVFDFEYRVTNGCAYDSIIGHVHVFGPSNAGEDGVIDACRNEPIDLYSGLNGTADLGGTWYDPSNNPISGSIIFSGNFPGSFNYDYIGGNGICPNDTANVVINIGACDFLSVEEEVFNGVTVFPNPSEGLVYVSNEGTTFDYTVLDAKGREIARKSAGVTAAATTAIDLSEVETGVYFIRLSNDQAQKLFRIVIR